MSPEKGTIKMSEDEIEPMLRMTRTAWDDLLLEGLNSKFAARAWHEEIARKVALANLPEEMADLRIRLIEGLNSAHLGDNEFNRSVSIMVRLLTDWIKYKRLGNNMYHLAHLGRKYPAERELLMQTSREMCGD